MIELQNIKKVYKERQKAIEVLHGVSLKIEKGEFIAVMGSSGSGKTTLLNIIGAVDKFDEGSYFYEGTEVNKLNFLQYNEFRKEHIGFIFQNYSLLDDCTIYENVELPLLVRNVNKQERRKRVFAVLEQMYISQYAKKFPSQLSGGEQQRCAIARAVVAGSDLILADEPTGALDSKNGEDVMNLLRDLNEKNGITIVMVTHDKKVAEYANRIIKIEDGSIQV